MMADQPRWPLRDYFGGIAQYAFETRLGIVDPPLVDYITDLLARFIRSDALYAVRDLSGNRLEQVGDMLAEAETRVGDARRKVHQHIGDFTLFWSGVYPEALRRSRKAVPTDRDPVVDFCTHGKRAYYIASTIPAERTDAQNEVLERLSEEFEICAFGLGEARKEWERRDPPGSWQLMVFQ